MEEGIEKVVIGGPTTEEIICPSCGSKLLLTTAPLPQAELEDLKCPRCGADIGLGLSVEEVKSSRVPLFIVLVIGALVLAALSRMRGGSK